MSVINSTWATTSGLTVYQGTIVINNYLYGFKYTGSTTAFIYKISTNDPVGDINLTWATVTATAAPGINGIGTDGTYLYVNLIPTTSAVFSKLIKINLSNSTDQTVINVPSSYALAYSMTLGVGYIYTVVATNSNVFSLIRVPLNNPTATEEVLVSNLGSFGDYTMVYNNDNLYIHNYANKRIDKYNITSTTYTSGWATNIFPTDNRPFGAFGMAITNSYLYYTTPNFSGHNNSLISIDLNNPSNTATLVSESDGLGISASIAIDNNYIYLCSSPSFSSGFILRYTYNAPTLPQPPCFHEDSKILTDRGYVLIKELKRGDLVQTLYCGLVPIYAVGYRNMTNISSNERLKSQLYICQPSKYPELTEPLILTGCHSILVDTIESEEVKNKIREVQRQLYVTEGKLRVPACCDPRADIYGIDGEYTIYHIALEHDDYFMNYGVYANGGLMVETCSKRYLKELSGMTLK